MTGKSTHDQDENLITLNCYEVHAIRYKMSCCGEDRIGCIVSYAIKINVRNKQKKLDMPFTD